MNYSNNQSAAQQPYMDEQLSEKAFESAMGKLKSINNETSSYCYQIEEKLHNILNMREPQKEIANPIPSISDFASDLNNELQAADNNLRRLIKIYDHLNKII